jgi:hypothetical protein
MEMAEKALEIEEAIDSGRAERAKMLLETERTSASGMEWM